MSRLNIQFLIVTLLAVAVLTASPAAAQILSGGQPDPGYNSNAMQVWLRADSGVTRSPVFSNSME